MKYMKSTSLSSQESALNKVVYRATVTIATKKETYVGLTANQFKDKWYTQIRMVISIEHPERKTSARLSSKIFELNDSNKNIK